MDAETAKEVAFVCRAACPPRIRSMREFAESEIMISDGPRQGPFRCSTQPYTGLLLDEIDSGRWQRVACVGPTQSGKTLAAFVIPTLYHLFEVGETVICGVPSLEMAGDKWNRDLLPAIRASRYASLLPVDGEGSKGGQVTSITFANGATLRFMSGGGGDKQRAGFTARVLVVTEADGLDVTGRTSREADKITQLEARTRAYGERRRVYLECTASTKEGRIWREYQQGTHSRIALQCPHCKAYVTLEREHFGGIADAESELEAEEKGAFACSACGATWTDAERRQANLRAVLVHEGQEISKPGEVTGKPRKTKTLGFRWSAANNEFASAKDIASEEWRAARNLADDNAEKAVNQFLWAMPYESMARSIDDLDVHEIASRTIAHQPRQCPRDTQRLTVGIDVGKRRCHWCAVAWSPEGTCHVPEYGVLQVAADRGVERAIVESLREFAVRCRLGWPIAEGPTRIPDAVWIDSRWQTSTVERFCYEAGGEIYKPTAGLSAVNRQVYRQPSASRGQVIAIGEQYHLLRLPKTNLRAVRINADAWKSWAHARLRTPVGSPGAMTLYSAHEREHEEFARHMLAERKVQEYRPGKGVIDRWEQVSKANHWLDALSIACAAGHYVGVRLLDSTQATSTVGGGRKMDLRSWFAAGKKGKR